MRKKQLESQVDRHKKGVERLRREVLYYLHTNAYSVYDFAPFAISRKNSRTKSRHPTNDRVQNQITFGKFATLMC